MAQQTWKACLASFDIRGIEECIIAWLFIIQWSLTRTNRWIKESTDELTLQKNIEPIQFSDSLVYHHSGDILQKRSSNFHKTFFTKINSDKVI